MTTGGSAAWRVTWTALMVALSALFVAPLLFMVSSSFKPEAQIFADLRSARAFLPVGELTLDHYRAVMSSSPLPSYLLNSIVISVITVGVGILINSAAAYGLQRFDWRGKRLALAGVLALLIIPFEITAIPLMLLVSRLPWLGWEGGGVVLEWSWFNSLHVQIVPFLANAFTIFLYHQAFADIPKELDEAARIDGAGPLRIYWSILMPNLGPINATAAIILFLGMWNQYLWPVLVVQDQAHRPVMVGLQQFFGNTTAWGEVMAYATLVTLPVLAVFVFFQRWFVASVMGAGIKG